jgi:hypothetical protein
MYPASVWYLNGNLPEIVHQFQGETENEEGSIRILNSGNARHPANQTLQRMRANALIKALMVKLFPVAYVY